MSIAGNWKLEIGQRLGAITGIMLFMFNFCVVVIYMFEMRLTYRLSICKN